MDKMNLKETIAKFQNMLQVFKECYEYTVKT